MSRKTPRPFQRRPSTPTSARPVAALAQVPSLLDAMQDGNEYGSIVSLTPAPEANLVDEIVRALDAIAAVRGRPCVAYVGNVVRRDDGDSGIDTTDDLPFAEMIARVPTSAREVDVLLVTRGGSAQQVGRFVNVLRSRFDHVDFLIPSFCMSAGTLFALSGDRIWMTDRACLGPIDPQVPSKDGRYVPAQALLVLLAELQRLGEESMKKGGSVPWTAVRIIDSMDKKDLGDAITATSYATKMATQFLLDHKLKAWTKHSAGNAVTEPEREQAALRIAAALASHERWKNHGHAIPREVLWNEIRLQIDHPDPVLDRALARTWALANWLFDKTSILKFIVSSQYRYVRQQAIQSGAKA